MVIRFVTLGYLNSHVSFGEFRSFQRFDKYRRLTDGTKAEEHSYSFEYRAIDDTHRGDEESTYEET